MSKKILYVEDHPPAQYLMKAIVGDLTPHDVLVAGTGAEALELARLHQPSLYILDLDLPDTDGLTLASDLYALHPAPIILVSAYAEAVDAANIPAHVCFYLAKPLDPDHVAQTIQRALA